jgi:hypothetical protein
VRVIDITGNKYGRLKVIELVGRTKHGKTIWKCKCNCGNIINVDKGNLISGNVKSCKCLQRERIIKAKTKHGFRKKNNTDKFYRIWQSMKTRCNNSNVINYKYYGGKGITYNIKWNDFVEFKKDMYFKYLYAVKQLKIKQPSIERINVNDNYHFKNCTFIELNNQSRNRKTIRKFIAINKELQLKIVSENVNKFALDHKLCSTSIYYCLNKQQKQTNGWMFREIQ